MVVLREHSPEMIQDHPHKAHHTIWQAVAAEGEQPTTTCELYSYVTAIGGDYNLFFSPCLSRLLRMSHYIQIILLMWLQEVTTRVAAATYVALTKW